VAAKISETVDTTAAAASDDMCVGIILYLTGTKKIKRIQFNDMARESVALYEKKLINKKNRIRALSKMSKIKPE
jgi:hypothetical protein